MRIDGSFGEGGGQILRTSLSLAAVLGKPLEIVNIRAGRKKPGLQPQHLTCVRAIAKITNARVEGDSIGSTRLFFEPNGLQAGGYYEFDIGTAGATSLLLQCLLPPLLFADAPSALTLHGGTDVPFAPPSLFVERVFSKMLEAAGAKVNVRVPKHGFYPAGGGILHAKIQPAKRLEPLRFEKRGALAGIKAVVLSANLPDHVTQRQKNVVAKMLASAEVEVQNTLSAQSPGNLVYIQAEYGHATNGFSALGEVGKPAEVVAREAVEAFKSFDKTQACLEEHLTDQALLYAALAEGESVLNAQKVSAHAATNIAVLEQIAGARVKAEGTVLTVQGRGIRGR